MTRSKVTRISVTLPRELNREFEDTARAIGYRNRSKAVADALQKFIADYQALSRTRGGTFVGTITFTYAHETPGLLQSLTEIQHAYSEVITTTLHIHLDRHRCLETLAVKGGIDPLRKLIQRLKTLKTENLQHVLLPQKLEGKP
ncbi:CopG family ribbon-helix-helix protein [Candidatus Hecatella orcuttiae]|uniref:CopG family ribbon-helix-helix protein n=1 Tax=Candidatus Hecatella orcuttiae TaxID=1935119 RepID=UPI0028682A08|nr:CopG family ribbon-helix-helix protein [Candidatus Hecatella orcuttiae]